MIQHVYERASQVSLFQEVIVATDDERIYQTVREFDGQVRMTSPEHQTGTDRIAEVARSLDADIVVNVQGDEPLIQPDMIARAIHPLLHDPEIAIGTLKHKIKTPDELFDPNVVKVITDLRDRALYFSRSPIPYIKGKDMRAEGFRAFPFFRHIGLYVFRRDFLLHFVTLPQSPLELVEGLEQLRALEHGYVITVVETSYQSIGVDTPEDVEKVMRLISA
jgi:3-deoxy-manno-octulosonate cytidylyltransferase (CMP-KDO synthetase)